MRRFLAIATTLCISVMACRPVSAQMPGTSDQADMPMTAASRQQLLDSLIKEVNNSYVFPDMAKKVDLLLRERQQRGAYGSITSARQLSEALTHDLQKFTKDRHLRVMYSEKAIPMNKPDGRQTPEDVASKLARMRANNFGVEKIEHLPFNIGYLELSGFASANAAADTLAAAMVVLAHTDALIIDLRKNGGGDAATVALLAGYLFDKRTHLNDFYDRRGSRTEQRWTADVKPGLRYGAQKDVYILSSKDTFSAAEDFTYALKNMKRVTVVGETTGGGANAGDVFRLSPNFAAFVPYSRAISPITNTNWETVGVTPDVDVRAGDALKIAQAAILTKMTIAEKDSAKLGRLNDRIVEVLDEDTRRSPVQ